MLADPHKTQESSLVMVLPACIAGFAAMLAASPLSWPVCMVCTSIAAPAAAYVELISRGGNDTITAPTAGAFVLMLLNSL